MKNVRFRIRADHLEPLEPVHLVEGAEIEASVPVVEPDAGATRPRVELDTWDLGPMEVLTREMIYEDVG